MQRSRDSVISYAANTMAWLDPGYWLAALAACGLLAAGLRRGPDRDTTRSARRVAVMYTLVAVVGIALALGPEPTVNGVRLMASGPYDWLRGIVPGLDGLRVPRRAIIIALLALTVLAAFGVRFLLERLPLRPGRALALLLCGLAVVESENYRPVPLVAFETPPSLQAAQAWLRSRPPGAVLTLPAIGHRQGGDYDNDLRAMYATLTHQHPVMNGATGFFPPLYWFFNSSGALESFDDDATASHTPDELIYAFDGDTETRWLSFGDYPRHLIIESTADGRTWETLHSGRGFERLLPGAVPVDDFAFMDFPHPPNTSRLIRLRQTANTPMFYWSFHEVELWERE